MSTSYIVAAPLVVIRDAAGLDRYLYRGAVVPSDVDKEHQALLVDAGMLAKVEQATQPVQNDGPPARSANKSEWEAYARSQGATDADLEGKSKDDLVDTYGG